MPIASHLLPSEPQTEGPMPGVSEGPIDDGAGAVAQQEGDRPFVVVDDVGELLRADDQDVVGGTGADQRVGLGDAVAVARAGGGDVEGRGRRGTDPVGQAGGGGRRRRTGG